MSGLGRVGGGQASPATSSTIIMSSTWASVVPAGKVPKDTAPPFRRPLCPSWRAGFAPIPTKSGASRASGLICGSWERRRELGANTYRVLVPPTSTRGIDRRLNGLAGPEKAALLLGTPGSVRFLSQNFCTRRRLRRRR